MASFNKAYQILKPNEGGYRNVSWDRGGETYRGITRKWWPSWTGWNWIDNYKAHNGAISNGKVFPELEGAVMEFVKNNYWQPIKGDQINNQQLANMVLDFKYQSGQAARKINEALGTGSGNSITYATVEALNAKPADAFNKIKNARLKYYRALNQSGSISDKDIEGVLARVKRLAAPAAVAAGGLGIIAAGLLFFC